MIPNILHFVFGLSEDFGGKPFSLVHYLAIKSAIELNQPKEVCFYYKYEPAGAYWEKIKPYLTMYKVEPPNAIFGNPVTHVANKTDIIRLEVLLTKGGIYMDMDTICKKPFTDLLDHKVVMGVEALQGGTNVVGLCNGVILSEKGTKFLEKWYGMFTVFDQTKWNMHAVIVPYMLSQKIPEEIFIKAYDTFHYPLWDEQGLKMLFEEVHECPNSYTHHLWESQSWDKYLKNLTEDYIKTVDTTYNLVARNFI